MLRLRCCFIVALALINKSSLGEKLRVQNHDGFGYELIQSKLESLEFRFFERFDRLEKQVEVVQQQLNGNVGRNITQLEKRLKVCLESKVIQKPDQVSKPPQTISCKHDPLQGKSLDQVDCSQLPKAMSGLCLMNIDSNKTLVYQVHRFEVEWLTVLQRFDGSENFDRNWTDYRDGFGTAGQEFWLGLERLHVLTKAAAYELLIELEDFNGTSKYARYGRFWIGPEHDLYRLNVLGTYSGTAGDSFIYHEGLQFSALDKGPNINCVNLYTGGWWYTNCFKSHLTGKWQHLNTLDSIVWSTFGSERNTGLKFARMLIRRI